MKLLEYIAIGTLIIFLYLFQNSCASQKPPTGGPKDTIPPNLINSIPADKSTNFKGQEIYLEFDEYIKTDPLSQKLIITPTIKGKFKGTANKNVLKVVFDEPFKENTTYTLNFTDAIKDIKEGMEAKNITLAFSTGPDIDSMYVRGKITDLMTGEPRKEILVGLYPLSDSTDIFNDKPLYFNKSDEEGNYSIENVQVGEYYVYAFEDENNNLKIEPLEEDHGFLSSPIYLFEPLEEINFPVYSADARKLRIISERTVDHYYELKYSKTLKSFRINVRIKGMEDKKLQASINGEADILRIYKPDIRLDSIPVSILAMDSLNNINRHDTFLKFKKSKKAIKPLEVTFRPDEGKKQSRNFKIDIQFNKPIQRINPDSIDFYYDEYRYFTLSHDDFTYNDNRQVLTLEKYIGIEPWKSDSNFIKSELPEEVPINLYMKKGTFISIENDTLELKEKEYEVIFPEKGGIIRGKVITDASFFILELINEKYQPIRKIVNKKQYEFKDIEPGKYTIRILVDNNQDGKWSKGNLIRQREPDDVLFYTEEFTVRANWELNDVDLEF